MKLPPMKQNFVSRKPNFFKKITPAYEEKPVVPKMRQPVQLPKLEAKPVIKLKAEPVEVVAEVQVDRPPLEKQKSAEFKGTNTLTYSETVRQGTSGDSANGNGNTEFNTVFKFTDKPRNEGEAEEHIEEEISELVNESKNDYYQEALTKSQHFDWPVEKPAQDNVTKSNFIDSKMSNKVATPVDEEKDHDTSEVIGQNEITELYERKAKLIPEFKAVWFQFHTDAVYCNVTGLGIVVNKKEYGVPFALAKIVLMSNENLISFLKHCDFHDAGTVDFDYLHIEELKNKPVNAEQDFEDDLVEVNGVIYGIE